MMVRNFLKNLRVLELRFEYVLLIALAHAVACFCSLFYLVQQLLAFQQDPKRLLNIGELKIGRLQIAHHSPADGISLSFHGVRFVLGNTGTQWTLAWIRQVL